VDGLSLAIGNNGDLFSLPVCAYVKLN
jgi:hypothetical protein